MQGQLIKLQIYFVQRHSCLEYWMGFSVKLGISSNIWYFSMIKKALHYAIELESISLQLLAENLRFLDWESSSTWDNRPELDLRPLMQSRSRTLSLRERLLYDGGFCIEWPIAETLAYSVDGPIWRKARVKRFVVGKREIPWVLLLHILKGKKTNKFYAGSIWRIKISQG